MFSSKSSFFFISETKWDTSGFNCGVLRATKEKRIDPAPCTRRYKYLFCAKNGMLSSRKMLLLYKQTNYVANKIVA